MADEQPIERGTTGNETEGLEANDDGAFEVKTPGGQVFVMSGPAKQEFMNYITDHQLPKDLFLRAILKNDLLEAVHLAPEEVVGHIPAFVFWMAYSAPGSSWGSPEAVEAWGKKPEDGKVAVYPAIITDAPETEPVSSEEHDWISNESHSPSLDPKDNEILDWIAHRSHVSKLVREWLDELRVKRDALRSETISPMERQWLQRLTCDSSSALSKEETEMVKFLCMEERCSALEREWLDRFLIKRTKPRADDGFTVIQEPEIGGHA